METGMHVCALINPRGSLPLAKQQKFNKPDDGFVLLINNYKTKEICACKHTHTSHYEGKPVVSESASARPHQFAFTVGCLIIAIVNWYTNIDSVFRWCARIYWHTDRQHTQMCTHNTQHHIFPVYICLAVGRGNLKHFILMRRFCCEIYIFASEINWTCHWCPHVQINHQQSSH